MRWSLVFAAFTSIAAAQQGPYGGDDYYQDYGGRQEGDNLYANYAARQNDRETGAGFGLVKLFAVGVGGYFAGSKLQKRKLQKELPKLRFKVKQRVKCKMDSNEWATGTVVGLWHINSSSEHYVYMPYQVRLDGGQMIFAPQDHEYTIQAIKK
mmetsp:Transcript_36245/g.36480  ORF Transcript_36245/g.36480 Transcript_36245/m.36480 type:complete len:153 (-) Transcript_36245:156-614(-)